MKLTTHERICLGLIIGFITLIIVFFGCRKVDYYIDELWTYGLANNIGDTLPNIEFGQKYSGMGPYEKFFEVQKGHGFDYVNVWQNQANDVHPPLYYVLFHTLCSFFPNMFSKWYGIVLNIFWMIGITFILYKLSKEITQSVLASAGMVLAYETTALFINTILFIRMYAQVTFFVIALAYLIKKYWDKPLDKKYIIWFGVITVLGMMTHYYFLIIAFALFVSFTIKLIIEKRLIELRTAILVALCSGVAFLLCWYHFLGHLFRGYRGKEAIDSALSFGGGIDGAIKMFSIINREAFAGMIIAFGLALFALIIIWLRKKEKIPGYESALLLSAIFYVIVVGKIAPYKDDRYLMPVVFAFVLTAYITVRELLSICVKSYKFEYLIISIFMLMSFSNVAGQGFYVKMDFFREDKNELMDFINDKSCIVYIDNTWEALYYYTALQHAKSYEFVNKDNVDSVIGEQMESFLLVSTPHEVNSFIDTIGARELYYHGQDAYYWVEK